MIPTVLFFARNYQSVFFPHLKSDKYKSVFAVLTIYEKKNVLENGGVNVICFEEEYDKLHFDEPLGSYLKYSYGCDRSYVGLSLSEREMILKKEIAFWRAIITEYKPVLVINEQIAIEFSEVLAIEAKKQNVRYLSWMSFPKKNTFYWQASPYHNSLKTNLDDLIPSDEEINEARTLIEGVKEGAVRPFYVTKTKSRTSISKLIILIKSFLRELIPVFTKSRIKRKVIYTNLPMLRAKDIKLYFTSLFLSSKYDKIEDYEGKELIFYPLHYEPEAVLFYMAYFFDNQVTVIENILKCINQNQFLVIKEHPQQLGLLLENRFRKIKDRYPNLLFIKGEEKTVQIINKCNTVVTLGSTAGFEALTLGKNVISLGRVFYNSFEGTNKCRSFDQVYDLLRGNTPFKNNEGFDIFVAKMLNYIKDGNPFFHENLYDRANIRLIVKAIEDEIY